jgi:hypothetical protein
MDIKATKDDCSDPATDDYLEISERKDGKNVSRICGTATDKLKKPVELENGVVIYSFSSNSDDKIGSGFVIELEATKRVLPKGW